MNVADDQHINSAKVELRRIQSNMEAGENNWDAHLSTARGVIASIDSTSLMRRADRPADQTLIISGLQNLAYHDADLGGVQDIADWCVSQWLSIVQRDPENVDALQGMPRPSAFLMSCPGRQTIRLTMSRTGQGMAISFAACSSSHSPRRGQFVQWPEQWEAWYRKWYILYLE